MTIEPKCYVCGKEGPCINGLCADCTMNELWTPGKAFAATFGALDNSFKVGDTVRLVGDRMGIPAGTSGEILYVGDKFEVRFYTPGGSVTITCRYDDLTKG